MGGRCGRHIVETCRKIIVIPPLTNDLSKTRPTIIKMSVSPPGSPAQRASARPVGAGPTRVGIALRALMLRAVVWMCNPFNSQMTERLRDQLDQLGPVGVCATTLPGHCSNPVCDAVDGLTCRTRSGAPDD